MFVKATLTSALAGLAAASIPEAERVPYLPGMATFDKFGLFSGYVDIPNTQKSMHYLFVESASDPVNDPLIFWFNGGPGCSSMLGFAQEHGPYMIADGTDYWQENPWSWNKEANVLYVESPAGVGYSYCATEAECTFNDTTSAEDNLSFVLGWFEKYNDYKVNDFYISGESYAGIYVPLLSNNIVNYNEAHATESDVFKPNLKGFAVGNGVTNWAYDCTPAMVDLYYYHTMFNMELWNKMTEAGCDYGTLDPYGPSVSLACRSFLLELTVDTRDIDTYNIDGICYGHGPYPQLAETRETEVNGSVRKYKRGATQYEYTPWIEPKDEQGNSSIPPCVFGTPISDYLNRQDIRELLYIPDYVQSWELCTSGINYTIGANASQWAYDDLHGKIRMLHYSGYSDGSVPAVGTRAWINTTGWEVTEHWRPYFYEGQVAGYVEGREGNFTFGTVHGAGHMAPQFKPPQTYHLIFNWINQTPI